MLTDVILNFNTLPKESTSLIFKTNGFVLPANDGHLQGIQRVGRNHFVITKSGRKPTLLLNFIKVYNGEREPLFFVVRFEGGLRNNSQGSIVYMHNINDQFGSYKKDHPGGFQMIGNIAAFGMESLHDKESSIIVFYDFSIPENPKPINYVVERNFNSAGTVALMEYDNKILMVVGGKDTETLDFYISNGAPISSETFHFSLFKRWTLQGANIHGWIDAHWGNLYESINLVRDKSGVFLIGCNNNQAEDWIDLYSLDLNATSSEMLQKIAKKHLYVRNDCSLEYGSGFHVDGQLGNMALYVTQKQAYNSDNCIIDVFEGASIAAEMPDTFQP